MATARFSTFVVFLALAVAEKNAAEGKSLMQKGGALPVLKRLDGLSELGDAEALLLEEEEEVPEFLTSKGLEILPSKGPEPGEGQCTATARTGSRGMVASGILWLASLLPEILSFATALIGIKILAALLLPDIFRRSTSCKVEEVEDEDAWIDELPDDEPVTQSNYKEERDAFDCTALHVACHNGCLPEVLELLELGADTKAQEAFGETPLHMAARAGSRECCEALLAAKADVNAKRADNKTPLIVAAQARQEGVCELLLDKKATAGMADEDLPPLLSSLLLLRLLQGGAEEAH